MPYSDCGSEFLLFPFGAMLWVHLGTLGGQEV